MIFESKKVVIAGGGVAGKGAYELSKTKGLNPIYYTDESSLRGAELVVISPGFPLNHEIFSLCKSKSIPVIGEIEFGYRYCRKPIVAVTGTNGKTTTVKLISEIFRSFKINAKECGNIGISFCEVVAKGDFDVAILEVSSFQLQTIVDFRPNIAIILNIGEDHLDRHLTRQNYAEAKLNIAKNMGFDDVLILGGEIECGLLDKLMPDCKVLFTEVNTLGAYVADNNICFGSEKICPVSAIKMSGEHNVKNALAAVAAAKLFGISNEIIRNVLQNFEPPSHRIQYVDSIAGIKFYNDSKGTNIDAALAAVKTVPGEICLLIGGSDKGEDFGRLFRSLNNKVKEVIAMGEIKNKIALSASDCGFENIKLCDGLEQAVIMSLNSGCDTVLLSPAAASFDRYSGYAQRGEHFVSLIKGIKSER